MPDVDALERWERCITAIEHLALVVEQVATDVQGVVATMAPEVASAALRPGAVGALRLSARGAAEVAGKCRSLLDEVGTDWRAAVRDLPADERASGTRRFVLLDEHEDLLDAG